MILVPAEAAGNSSIATDRDYPDPDPVMHAGVTIKSLY
jgi:hypothetical protein